MYTFKRAPKSNASAKLEYLKSLQEQSIELYPKKETKSKSYGEQAYDSWMGKKKFNNNWIQFVEEAQKSLLTNAIYYAILEPVLEEQAANSHERSVGAGVINDFVNEHNVPELLNEWAHKSIYLSDISRIIDQHLVSVLETCKEKIKEGLPEEDAFKIEDHDIESFVLDIKDKIPKDVTKIIADRVQDSVDEFIDYNKRNKFEIKKIYDQAKQKIDELDAAENTMDGSQQIIVNTPEDVQQMQQEAINIAKRKERAILEAPCNVFNSMTQIMLESIHSVDVLKEAYTTEYNKINFGKVVNDTKVMYSFLECLNTLNMIPINEDYIAKMLNGMKKSISEKK
jgi:hypothetical protein